MDQLLELTAQHCGLVLALAGLAVLACIVLAVVTSVSRRATARHRMELALLRRRYAAVLASTSDGILLQSATGQIIDVNAAAREMLGLDGQDFSGVLVADLPVVLVNAQGQSLNPAAVMRHSPAAINRATTAIDAELVGIARPGQPLSAARMVQVVSRMVAGGGMGAPVILTTIEDMTVQGEVKAALERSELQFRVAMENAPIGMALVDLSWNIIEVNSAFAELLGTTREALVGYSFSDISHPEDREQERMLVQALLAGAQSRFSLEKRYLRADGHVVWTMLDVALVRTPNSASDHFVAQVRDTTESRLKSEMLAHRAMHDPLTGLANRTLLQEVLQSVLDQPRRDRVAVLACDLDGFKQINDRYGHAAGDEVLVHVAGVLRAAIGPRGTVARMGGDEFVIVLQDMESERVAFEVATAIHANLKEPLRLHRRRMVVRASIGIALADADTMAGGAPGLLAAADAALYRAKAAGRSTTEVYDTTMEVSGGMHGLQSEMQGALERREIVLHYQPFVDLATGVVLGHEALVRWQHPSRGLLLPGMFLSVAEEMGLGVPLGMHVVSEAVGYLARCKDQSRWVSVNVSADQLGDGEFAARLLEESSRYRVAPGRLVIELTETSLVDAGTRVRHELTQLRAAGIPVLLDDFGTGVSPLSYLRDLPVNGVKLDMSFTAGIPEDPAAARVSRALGALARELDMITIAEGIETEEQAQFLHHNGWRYGQGWLFGSAQPESALD